MKNLVYFFVLFLLISCSVNEKLVFIKVDNIKLIRYTSDTIRLKATVFFENPNDIGGKISTDKINVLVNGTEIAQVSSDEFKVPARKEFTVPLRAVIPTRKIFENNKNGVLGSLLNSVLNRSIKVQFKGVLNYKILGFSKDYLIDTTENIKF